MLSNPTNLGKLTPIHTDFGNNTGDLLVAEYDVPQTKVKQTLFYKYGQLSIPKWALIPAGIVGFGLLTALCAIILNAILSEKVSTVTYSQACSKTSKCKSDVGLTCGSESKCVCPNAQYWYEDRCVNQPTYGENCNQTTECRTDLGLTCAEVAGQCNCPTTTIVQTCDCSSTSYWTGSACTPRLSYQGACNAIDTSYQCINTLYCNGAKCICSPNSQYWNSTASECYSVDKYQNLCDPLTSYSCDASASLFCLPAGVGSQCPFNVTANTTSCDCANGTYWNGGSCVPKKIYNAACFWNCECDSTAGLQCLNKTCICPKNNYWSTVLPSCQAQKNYNESLCYTTSECDSSKGLTCYLNGTACNCPALSTEKMCDCLPTQYYDYNLTSCQTLHLYNDSCIGNYTCDSSLGLFCQLTNTNATNCSCPEPIRLNMCDCGITSYWDGVGCVPRLAPNTSCSFPYQCQMNYICIVNETDNGIFSDVCRCPLGSYYVNGSGCVPSMNYTANCAGSYQCNELAILSCRDNDTGLTCLDTNIYPLPACDCSDNYYFDFVSVKCQPLLNRFNVCTNSCQCSPPYQCVSGSCDCRYYYSSLNLSCVDYLTYDDKCTNTAQCNATPGAQLICTNMTCGCGALGYWDGSQCQSGIHLGATCTGDRNCASPLKCRNISCVSSSKRCSCDDEKYYSPNQTSCLLCNGSVGGYKKYVINYPSSDLCVFVLPLPSRPDQSIAFTTADTQCKSVSPIVSSGKTPQLLSVHNQTELNCIGNAIYKGGNVCKNSWFYYIGLTSINGTFYDGTFYNSSFPNSTVDPTKCLVYCFNDDQSGSLYFKPCLDTSSSYGAICDYRIN